MRAGGRDGEQRKSETFFASAGFPGMKFFLTLVLWAVLLVLCWPLALLLLVIWPVVWLPSIPFRILAAVVEGMLALVRALFFLPARLLGWSPAR